ncbi:PHF5-like protein [Gossypium australe]|uniref:PHF5-like protein n=1 Tax=Gossypium australe TaxID=47621 RepID=A0A5B6UBW9_9ROSI|nr:PHF5-like protein [Gossypium australe]
MCRKQPGIAIGRLCEKCDGKCVICDSYVCPCTLVRVCDECNYGSFQGKCVICGGVGISDAYYCKECTQQEKDRDGCPKIVNLGSAKTDLFYERMSDFRICWYPRETLGHMLVSQRDIRFAYLVLVPVDVNDSQVVVNDSLQAFYACSSIALPHSSLPSQEDLIYAVLHPLLMVIGFILISGEGKSENEWLVGFLSFWHRGEVRTTRAKVLPWHIFLGLYTYGLAVATAETGLLEKLTFLQSRRTASKHCPESMIVNSLGLGLVLLCGIVILTAVSPKYHALQTKLIKFLSRGMDIDLRCARCRQDGKDLEHGQHTDIRRRILCLLWGIRFASNIILWNKKFMTVEHLVHDNTEWVAMVRNDEGKFVQCISGLVAISFLVSNLYPSVWLEQLCPTRTALICIICPSSIGHIVVTDKWANLDEYEGSYDWGILGEPTSSDLGAFVVLLLLVFLRSFSLINIVYFS